jgi:hypothetical protein
MDFTFEEIDHLISRGELSKDSAHKFGISSAGGSSNQGFGYTYIYKNEKGEVIESWSTPGNVDCDDGSYTSYSGKRKYKTFQDYKEGKPFEDKEESD